MSVLEVTRRMHFYNAWANSLGRSPGDLDYGTFEEYRAVLGDDKTPGAIR